MLFYTTVKFIFITMKEMGAEMDTLSRSARNANYARKFAETTPIFRKHAGFGETGAVHPEPACPSLG